MVIFCSQCFETGNKCPRADDNTRTCQFVVADPAALRLASGGYDAQLSQASTTLSGIAPQHVDALLSYVPAAATATTLTAEEQAILNSEGNAVPFDQLDPSNLELGLSLARKRPAKYEALKSRLERLVTLSTGQVNILKLQTILGILANDYIEGNRAQSATPTTNSTTLTHWHCTNCIELSNVKG